ncbi:chromate transporter [Rhodoferax sp. PAMC 29310]|uniref:chromate transporter n=1 Tax=Rhodoferax sp. PAMC 29310 TaxID=2822760 RepID=UPI001F0B1971|nr:chromate transporter [Rhodoferax sp. PAMC 29310]
MNMTPADWLALLTHFMSLSLLAIGGAITTAPEMHRFLVDERHWLTDSQFSSSIALAQTAPGPNVLFIALLGWNVGVNAGGGLGAGPMAWGLAALGMIIAMAGILVPSTTLTFAAARWAHRHKELRVVRAFKQGMAPIVIALLIATGLILALSQGRSLDHWRSWLLTAFSALVVWRTRVHLLWLLGLGGLVGWFNWI